MTAVLSMPIVDPRIARRNAAIVMLVAGAKADEAKEAANKAASVLSAAMDGSDQLARLRAAIKVGEAREHLQLCTDVLLRACLRFAELSHVPDEPCRCFSCRSEGTR